MTKLFNYFRYHTIFASLCVLLVLLVCIVFADFSTKGEPREALVAVSMLSSGNWILPVDLSGDMAYKPPLFHWLIALFSLPFGHVNEFTSRLPSALALAALWYLTARFFSVRSRSTGLITALLMLTSFEVFRAGTVCRVDMMLTLGITGAMMALFKATQTGTMRLRRLWYTAAVLSMSAATLTKGPVGILLPLGVYWIYSLIRGANFLRISLLSLFLLLLSLILPALWYYAAYLQGGDRFLSLALEENFGRFLGHMTYESHVKPFWYNITSLLLGYLPYSLALIILISIYSRKALPVSLSHLKSLWQRTKSADPILLFSIIVLVIIFIFYSIPKSKRSVYLLPMYPFMAYLTVLYLRKLVNRGCLSLRLLTRCTGSIILLYIIGFGVVFPIIASNNSDKVKAQEIVSMVPDGTIYTYIPDRFIRFYITDFYLGGRLRSLMPSMQVQDNDTVPSDSRAIINIPKNDFYLLTAEQYLAQQSPVGLSDRLEEKSLRADTLYISKSKAHDIKSKLILLRIKHNGN